MEDGACHGVLTPAEALGTMHFLDVLAAQGQTWSVKDLALAA